MILPHPSLISVFLYFILAFLDEIGIAEFRIVGLFFLFEGVKSTKKLNKNNKFYGRLDFYKNSYGVFSATFKIKV